MMEDMQHTSAETAATADYRLSHTRPGKAKEYDSRFTDNAHRRMVWRLEQLVLKDVADRYLPPRFRHLDFACGTGRILHCLEPLAGSSTGVDVSDEMLSLARSRLPTATLHNADLTRQDVLAGERFDLITAFRFFPNAQPTLRREAMAAIVRHLSDNGVVVFNNHLNNESLRYRISRLFGRKLPEGMSPAEAVDLISGAGLQVKRVYHIGVVPSEERFLLLPAPVLEGLERQAMRGEFLRPLAQNLIYVCERRQATLSSMS